MNCLFYDNDADLVFNTFLDSFFIFDRIMPNSHSHSIYLYRCPDYVAVSPQLQFWTVITSFNMF